MTDATGAPDVLGLAGTFPRPGWVVLDAARDQRFTGELVIQTRSEFRVYLDRGRIYLAERVAEPSLGARLVDAGAINAAQLEHGAMRVGDHEHLGRLFERVPSVDRQFVVIVTELMNEACVADIAAAQVSTVTATPYRHHPAGVHHWDRPANSQDLRPGDPLPAPEPADAPVENAPPESLFTMTSNDTDMLVRWNEPSWLDDTRASARRRSPAHHDAEHDVDHESESASVSVLGDDWADHLEVTGLPEPGDDPLARPTPLPRIANEQLDRFEVIWPSGDVEDDFDITVGDPVADRDRVGPTARVVRTEMRTSPAVPPDGDRRSDQHARAAESATSPSDATSIAADAPIAAIDAADDPTMTDDVVLSVRRAVASIDTGSLDARRRLADVQTPPAPTIEPEPPTLPAVPRTTVVRPAPNPTSAWSSHPNERDGSPSVFDEPVGGVPEIPASIGESTAAERAPGDVGNAAPIEIELETTSGERSGTTETPGDASEPARVSALRRLIGGLRRR